LSEKESENKKLLEDSQQTQQQYNKLQEKVGQIQQAERKLADIQSEEATIKAIIADHQKYTKEEQEKLNKELEQKKTAIQEQISTELKNVEKYRAEALAEKSAAEKLKNDTNTLRENNAKLINDLEAEILAHENDLAELHKIRAEMQSEKEKILSGITEEKKKLRSKKRKKYLTKFPKKLHRKNYEDNKLLRIDLNKKKN